MCRELVGKTQNPEVSSARIFPGGAAGPPALVRAEARSAWVRASLPGTAGNSALNEAGSVQWASLDGTHECPVVEVAETDFEVGEVVQQCGVELGVPFVQVESAGAVTAGQEHVRVESLGAQPLFNPGARCRHR